MTERAHRVIYAVGPDKPGLVASLTGYIAEQGGNVEESIMGVLGGSFGLMMLISGTRAIIADIEAGIASLESRSGLRIHLEETTSPVDQAAAHRFSIKVEAADRQGIVSSISEVLLRLGANIYKAESNLYPAPVSGAPLFRLDLLVDLPPEVDVNRINAELAALAEDEDLDVQVAQV